MMKKGTKQDKILLLCHFRLVPTVDCKKITIKLSSIQTWFQNKIQVFVHGQACASSKTFFRGKLLLFLCKS